MINTLLNEISAHDHRGAIVPISCIDDLKQDMEDIKNGDLHTVAIGWMIGSIDKFVPAELDIIPRSIISVVVPCPQISLEFIYRGKSIDCLLPPTYTEMCSKEAEILQYINAFLKPYNFKAVPADYLPHKMLAVHCGLGRYGRNNICYNEEFGSFIRLQSYISDIPCGETDWFPLRRMDTCKKCHICVDACPTNAIDLNRTIINADVCLTFMNEDANPFPDWLDGSAHHCLIGCMRCQNCCPHNIRNRNNVDKGISFTAEETAELLEHKDDKSCTDTLAAKIKAAGISTYTNVLPRNLAALLNNLSV